MAHFGHVNAPHGEHTGDYREDERSHSSRAPYDQRFGDEALSGDRERDAPRRDQWGGDRYGNRGGDRNSDYAAPQGRYDDDRGGKYHSRSRSRSRSRSPRRYSPAHASTGDRLPPHHHDNGCNGGASSTPRQWDSQPSATLIIRHAFAPFRPQSTRVMFHKVTGEHRGFAFANFDSVDAATATMNAFTSQPLLLDNQVVMLAYAETNRPSPHGPPHGAGYRDQGPHPPGGPPRMDWICDQCDSTNFARRTECFKCHANRSPFAMEMPARNDTRSQRQHQPMHYGGGRQDSGHSDEYAQSRPHFSEGPGRRDRYEDEFDEPPSHVLAVRMIPLDVDEGELQVVFAEYEGVRDIRLIRDRETNQSRGFAFVEFEDVEIATRAKETSSSLYIRGEQVRVGFARATLQSKPPSYRSGPPGNGFDPVPVNPMAAAALERAQWALANNYGGMHAQAGDKPAEAPAGLDDLDALLGNAAAAARPHIEEPKKSWPLPFETAGGMYRYMGECGLFYDNDSMFYYDPQSKLYYNSFMGIYYRCKNGIEGAKAVFEPFSPPPPCDDVKFSADAQPCGKTLQTPASESKPIAMTLSKKKAPLISFNLKPMTTTTAGKISSAFEAPETVNVASNPTGSAVGSGVSVAAAANASTRKKSAIDIAKWSHRQKEVTDDQAPADVLASKSSTPQAPVTSAVASLTAVVDVPLEAPICLLCRRKFGSMEQLRKHETLSKLHADNLAKAKQDKEIVGAQIRERDEEQRDQLTNKRKRVNGDSTAALPVQAQPEAVTAASSQEAAAANLESGIGAKMLKMMGWKKGEGLGKHGTGITAPIEAVGNVGSDTTGLGAKTTPAVDLSDIASYKERLQKMARARYDGADDHGRKAL